MKRYKVEVAVDKFNPRGLVRKTEVVEVCADNFFDAGQKAEDKLRTDEKNRYVTAGHVEEMGDCE